MGEGLLKPKRYYTVEKQTRTIRALKKPKSRGKPILGAKQVVGFTKTTFGF